MNASPLLSIYVSVRELDFWITPLCILHPERRSWGCPGIPRPESSLVYGIMRRGTTITVVLPEPLCRLSGNRRTEDVRTQHFSISGFTKLEYRTSPFHTISALPVLPPLSSLSSLENEGSAQRPVDKDHVKNQPKGRASSTAAYFNVSISVAWEYLSLSCSNDSPANLGWGSTL